jgi:hypothetical protein
MVADETDAEMVALANLELEELKVQSTQPNPHTRTSLLSLTTTILYTHPHHTTHTHFLLTPQPTKKTH